MESLTLRSPESRTKQGRGDVAAQARGKIGPEANRLQAQDRVVHDWYRFVLSFPPHLVRDYVRKFEIGPGACVLDPFCGTGTTLVECRKLGLNCTGIEANPIAHFASHVKLDWQVGPGTLRSRAESVAEAVLAQLDADGVPDSCDPLFDRKPHVVRLMMLNLRESQLLLENSISPRPAHKALRLREELSTQFGKRLQDHARLALAKTLVFSASNLRFGPEVGVGKPKEDASVVRPWLDNMRSMADDLRVLRDNPRTSTAVHAADSREVGGLFPAESFDAVITSPPYPNEKDYSRTTRLESVFLGFVRSKEDLRALKRTLIRSNTRGVYKADSDDSHVAEHSEIQRIAAEIEGRRIELGKTSGFERLYARVTMLYFGGMSRHLADLRPLLRPGALLAYVVGDQASYLQIMIRTGQLLASIADSLGYEVVGLELFRSRFATATGEMLREEVVVLRWPGYKKKGARRNREHVGDSKLKS
ncbi:MAG: DNA methyltransferase [candidate division Zixibacteria bacterium]|nr:DNA methyltransferase [candidate division Zixibacteria bacterium]